MPTVVGRCRAGGCGVHLSTLCRAGGILPAAMTQTKPCPLCGKRPARRSCPAKATLICSVCCGTKREVEIDCPSHCVYLAGGRTWEAGRKNVLSSSSHSRFSPQFLERHGAVINSLAKVIVRERHKAPTLVDRDVNSVIEALATTLRTLESGLYYETRPAGSLAATSLFQQMKEALDEWMHPRSGESVLRVSDAKAVLEFLLSTLETHGSDRPKSRRYLDWLESVFGMEVADEGPHLIVP